MSGLQDDFQETVEDIAQKAMAIERFEADYSTLEAADPRATTLSERDEELVAQLHHLSLAERDLVETAR